MDNTNIASFLDKVEEVTKKPEKYLSLQEDQAEVIKSLTQNLYNFTKKKEYSKNRVCNVLNELVIANVDEEQIWQQIELQNTLICTHLFGDLANLLAKKNSLKFPVKEKKMKNSKSNKTEPNNKENIESKVENEFNIKSNKKLKKQKTISSAIDDKFFKLHEMENFLELIEKGEDHNKSDDEVDYFNEEDSVGLDHDEEKQIHYNDFFDQPDIEENIDEDNEGNFETDYSEEFQTKNMAFKEKEKEKENENSCFKKRKTNESSEENISDVEFHFNNVEKKNAEEENIDTKMNDTEDEDSENYNNEEPRAVKQPSSFETRQKRIKTRIKSLEEEALKEKPWQLKGEISASNRPQNSLLEEYVEFDIATRPAPVFTEKSTLKLEHIILQRIKDKAWDDVIRKIKPIENDIEYKKKLVLDEEKSKLSLAQIYEQEYLKHLGSKNEAAVDKPEIEPPEHQEIRIMMNKLFYKLDALSNYHFTPRQVHPEAKIISNLPAINMEEVAPVAASDATLLAPEEVKPKPKRPLMGKSEQTATDKKRERRQKKLRQKLKFKLMDSKKKLKSEKLDFNDIQHKKISHSLLQRITKSSKVTQLEESNRTKDVKSSFTFFSKLQNETIAKINKKGINVEKPKLNKKASTKKLKTGSL